MRSWPAQLAFLFRMSPLLLGLACFGADSHPRWAGTVDTLPSGTIVVSNPEAGIWRADNAWRVVDETRIGTLDGDGPDMFGQITALEVGPLGRIYVYEGQAQELRVFERDGRHVRTVGRRGGGPGEFRQVIGMAWGPDGNLWVPDPQNNRISVFDTAGTLVTSHYMPGGWVMMPWRGGFDREGFFYNMVPIPDPDRGTQMALVRYSAALEPLDTLVPPEYTGPRNVFEIREEGRWITAGVPFSPTLGWRQDADGGFWAVLTGEYRLYRLSPAGDTLRIVTRAFTPVPVTSADIDSAITRLQWFTSQGGRVDRSRFPSVRPAVESVLHPDDEGNVWIVPQLAEADPDKGHVLDVFDPDGRYLGRVRLPFRFSSYPLPIFRDGRLLAVTTDDLDVPYVVSARIEQP